ncbi:MAG: hypothetical protein ACTSVZ_03965 [Promethearchaeota archaeon]
MKTHRKKAHSILFMLLFLFPLIISMSIQIRQSDIQPMISSTQDITQYEYDESLSYEERKELFLNISKINNDSFYAQATRIFFGLDPNEAVIRNGLEDVNNYEDTSDFDVNGYLRMLYFNNDTQVMSDELETELKNTILNFSYWIDEPSSEGFPDASDMYYWTENHMILFHAAELMAGQFYRNETFPGSNMTGQDHIDHAIPLIDRWLTWRGQFGFSEFHSNIYYSLDLAAILNIVEFSEDDDLSQKAAMVVDQIAFDFANNVYRSRYATSHGRTEDSRQFGVSLEDPANNESPMLAAWLLLGIGDNDTRFNDGGNRGAVSIATSDRYTMPPILEDIAKFAKPNNEHRERMGLNLADGPEYGIDYNEEDLMFWWGMSATAAPQIIDTTLEFQEKHDLSSKLIFNDPMFLDVLNIGAAISGTDISGYCEILGDITKGVALESVSTYTYRTPYYQLSGAQDYHKGKNGIQEHIWQATLDHQAMVYTNSPGGVSPQEFTGGWKPRATMYKNVGIFQYDRGSQSLLGELVIAYLGAKSYTHAYFPQWAFDEVVQEGKWTFGQKGDAYVALYSFERTTWMPNGEDPDNPYELRSEGKKNVYIIELGTIEDYSSFEAFKTEILGASVDVIQLSTGFDIEYDSPSRGMITVAWEGDMYADGVQVDLGPFERFENDFCTQDFGTKITTITYEGQTLVLNFEDNTRTYTSA